MPFDLKKALAKLDRPPAVHNWARFVGETRPETVKAILNFVKGVPQVVYSVGNTTIRDHFVLGIDRQTALTAVGRAGAPKSRQPNREFVEAFFDYEEERRHPTATCIEFERQWFRISRDLAVPVAPLVVLREKGRFIPVFVCGWSDLALTNAQRRLVMTISEDAFLSLTDFQDSPAEFLFFPKQRHGADKGKRKPEVWNRGDYELLRPADLNEQVALYVEARGAARTILLAEQEEKSRTEAEERDHRSDDGSSGMDDLFGSSRRK